MSAAADRDRRPIRSASDRALLMLSIVPWIAAHDGPRIDDVAARFDVDREYLVADLRVVSLVGLPPYTPDMLTEVVFSGERVWVRLADVFSRPLQLTPDQALGLIAAGSALARAAGDGDDAGPLGSGLAKLAALLGIQATDAVSIRLGASHPETLRSLQRAVEEGRRVRLDYYTYGRDVRRRREVDPFRVFSEAGAWYLYGHCHLAGEARLFRLDRIFALEVSGVRFERPEGADERPPLFGPTAETPRVTLALAPGAGWVAEHYPVEEVRPLPDGGLRVTMAVGSRAWLEKLLLRLGPDASLVDATEPGWIGAGRDAARRVLARYHH